EANEHGTPPSASTFDLLHPPAAHTPPNCAERHTATARPGAGNVGCRRNDAASTRDPPAVIDRRATGPDHRGATGKAADDYDGQYSQTLPGMVVRNEGAPDGADPAVNEAYNGLGATFDFYLAAYDRNSIDDKGLHLDATVHYGTNYDNAFWNGEQMVFGDG